MAPLERGDRNINACCCFGVILKHKSQICRRTNGSSKSTCKSQNIKRLVLESKYIDAEHLGALWDSVSHPVLTRDQWFDAIERDDIDLLVQKMTMLSKHVLPREIQSKIGDISLEFVHVFVKITA